MRDEQVGRLFRMVRIRNNWPQELVGERADLSASTICRIEDGQLARYHLDTIQRHGAALGLRVELRVIGRGGDVARTLDEEHAAIVEWVARLLVAAAWLVEPEASYSIYGERGRIDLLAFHPGSGTLLVVEVKTELTDLQALFGSMSVKERLAPRIAHERGWGVRCVSSLLALADMPATHRIVSQHGRLFAGFQRHALSIRSQLRTPRGAARLLLYVPAETATDGRRDDWLATRRRVHPSRPDERA
ncbi:MAG: hypothetical protein ACRDG7_17850 [Candidatus Limnocylindria bacterium]